MGAKYAKSGWVIGQDLTSNTSGYDAASMQKFVYFRRRRTLKHIGSRLEVTRGFASTGKASRCMGAFTALTNVLCMRSMLEGTSNAKSKESPGLLFQRRLF